MDEQKDVLISVSVNIDNALTDIKNLGNTIDVLKKKQLENTEEGSEAWIKLGLEIKNVTEQKRKLEKQVQKEIEITGKQVTSIASLQAANAKYREEIRNTDLQTEKGQKRIAELNMLVDANSETIKQNSDAMTKQKQNIGNYESGTVSLRAELKQLIAQMQLLSVAGKDDSKEFQVLAEKAAKLKDAMGDVNTKVNALAVDNKLEGFLNTSVQGMDAISGATRIAEGSLQLFGVQSESLTNTIKKLDGVQNIANGTTQIFNLLKKEGALMTGLMTIKTTILTGVMTTYNLVVGASTGAMKLFKLALAGTGIGAFIVGLGTLIANWKEVTNAMKTNNESWQNFKKVLLLISPPIFLIIKGIELITKNFDLLSEKVGSTGSYISSVFKNIGETINLFVSGDFSKAIKNIQNIAINAEKDYYKESKEIRDEQFKEKELETLKRETLLKEMILNIEKAKGKDVLDEEIQLAADKLKIAEQSETDKEKLVNEATINLLSLQKTQYENELKIREDAAKKAKELSDQQKADELEKLKEKVRITKENEKIESDYLAKKLEDERNAANESLIILDEQIQETLRIQSEGIELEKQARLIDEQNRTEIAKRNIFTQIENEKILLAEKQNLELIAAEQTGVDILLINEKYSLANRELQRAEIEARLNLYSNFSGNLAVIFGENTAIGKAAAVAQATINTYLGASSAFATTPGGIIIKSAAAAAAVIAGIANVKKILAVKSGLPEKTISTGTNISSGGGGGYSSNNPTNQSVNINPEIGRGIVARNLENNQNLQNTTQVAVVVDDVTRAQTIKKNQEVMKTI